MAFQGRRSSGGDGLGRPSYGAFDLFRQELVGGLEHANRETAVGRVGCVNRSRSSPYIVACGATSIVVIQTAFKDERLLHSTMPVKGQLCSRIHLEECCESLGVFVLPKDLHSDARKARFLPWGTGNVDVGRAPDRWVGHISFNLHIARGYVITLTFINDGSSDGSVVRGFQFVICDLIYVICHWLAMADLLGARLLVPRNARPQPPSKPPDLFGRRPT